MIDRADIFLWQSPLGRYDQTSTGTYLLDPAHKRVVGFSASTEIDRENFGLTWNVVLKTGGVMVSKKVRIEG
jgi:polyisoprenoid-binding protein YceI